MTINDGPDYTLLHSLEPIITDLFFFFFLSTAVIVSHLIAKFRPNLKLSKISSKSQTPVENHHRKKKTLKPQFETIVLVYPRNGETLFITTGDARTYVGNKKERKLKTKENVNFLTHEKEKATLFIIDVHVSHIATFRYFSG